MNTEFVTGVAGTGKTELMRNRVAEDSSYGVLASTTGISAINLGTRTLNSLLTYFDTASLERKSRSGKLRQALANLAQAGILGRNLIIDEVSMMPARQLDVLTDAMERTFGGHRGIVLTGDFGQLAPAGDDEDFAFKADCWSLYEENMTKLTKIYRQSSVEFLQALSLVRKGDSLGAQHLAAAGVEFASETDPQFEGITLVPTNAEANEINARAMMRLTTPPVMFAAATRGKHSPEWAQIPPVIMLKRGARVMVTANDKDGQFANGDLGEFIAENSGVSMVRLDRTGQEVDIWPVCRKNLDYTDDSNGRYLGEITFMPLKLSYGLTIHKCQGLTIPRVQLHIKHWFSGEPALIYVACSRVREAANLRVVGTVEELAKRIKSHPEAQEWL